MTPQDMLASLVYVFCAVFGIFILALATVSVIDAAIFWLRRKRESRRQWWR